MAQADGHEPTEREWLEGLTQEQRDAHVAMLDEISAELAEEIERGEL